MIQSILRLSGVRTQLAMGCALPLALGAVTEAGAATWHVDDDAYDLHADGSAAAPFVGFHDALAVAAPGDAIQLAEGDYRVVLGELHGVSVYGQGPESTRLEVAAGELSWDVDLDTYGDVAIESLTLRCESNRDQGLHADGMGQAASRLSVTDVDFAHCKTALLAQRAQVEVTGATFTSSPAYMGLDTRGVYAQNDSTVDVRDARFEVLYTGVEAVGGEISVVDSTAHDVSIGLRTRSATGVAAGILFERTHAGVLAGGDSRLAVRNSIFDDVSVPAVLEGGVVDVVHSTMSATGGDTALACSGVVQGPPDGDSNVVSTVELRVHNNAFRGYQKALEVEEFDACHVSEWTGNALYDPAGPVEIHGLSLDVWIGAEDIKNVPFDFDSRWAIQGSGLSPAFDDSAPEPPTALGLYADYWGEQRDWPADPGAVESDLVRFPPGLIGPRKPPRDPCQKCKQQSTR